MKQRKRPKYYTIPKVRGSRVAMLSLPSGTSLDRAPREVETNDLTRYSLTALGLANAASEACRKLGTSLLYYSAANPKGIILRVQVMVSGRARPANLGVVLTQLAQRTLNRVCHLSPFLQPKGRKSHASWLRRRLIKEPVREARQIEGSANL